MQKLDPYWSGMGEGEGNFASIKRMIRIKTDEILFVC